MEAASGLDSVENALVNDDDNELALAASEAFVEPCASWLKLTRSLLLALEVALLELVFELAETLLLRPLLAAEVDGLLTDFLLAGFDEERDEDEGLLERILAIAVWSLLGSYFLDRNRAVRRLIVRLPGRRSGAGNVTSFKCMLRKCCQVVKMHSSKDAWAKGLLNQFLLTTGDLHLGRLPESTGRFVSTATILFGYLAHVYVAPRT